MASGFLRRHRKGLLALLALCVLGPVVLFFVLTSSFGITRIVLPVAANATGIPITARGASLSLLSKLELQNLRIGPAAAPLFDAELLRVRYDGKQLLRGVPVVRELALENAKVRIVIGPDGTVEGVPAAGKTPPDQAPDGTAKPVALPPGLLLENIGIKGIDVDFIRKSADGKSDVEALLRDVRFACDSLSPGGKTALTFGARLERIAASALLLQSGSLEGSVDTELRADGLPGSASCTVRIGGLNGKAGTVPLNDLRVAVAAVLQATSADEWRVESASLTAEDAGGPMARLVASGLQIPPPEPLSGEARVTLAADLMRLSPILRAVAGEALPVVPMAGKVEGDLRLAVAGTADAPGGGVSGTVTLDGLLLKREETTVGPLGLRIDANLKSPDMKRFTIEQLVVASTSGGAALADAAVTGTAAITPEGSQADLDSITWTIHPQVVLPVVQTLTGTPLPVSVAGGTLTGKLAVSAVVEGKEARGTVAGTIGLAGIAIVKDGTALPPLDATINLDASAPNAGSVTVRRLALTSAAGGRRLLDVDCSATASKTDAGMAAAFERLRWELFPDVALPIAAAFSPEPLPLSCTGGTVSGNLVATLTQEGEKQAGSAKGTVSVGSLGLVSGDLVLEGLDAVLNFAAQTPSLKDEIRIDDLSLTATRGTTPIAALTVKGPLSVRPATATIAGSGKADLSLYPAELAPFFAILPKGTLPAVPTAGQVMATVDVRSTVAPATETDLVLTLRDIVLRSDAATAGPLSAVLSLKAASPDMKTVVLNSLELDTVSRGNPMLGLRFTGPLTVDAPTGGIAGKAKASLTLAPAELSPYAALLPDLSLPVVPTGGDFALELAADGKLAGETGEATVKCSIRGRDLAADQGGQRIGPVTLDADLDLNTPDLKQVTLSALRVRAAAGTRPLAELAMNGTAALTPGKTTVDAALTAERLDIDGLLALVPPSEDSSEESTGTDEPTEEPGPIDLNGTTAALKLDLKNVTYKALKTAVAGNVRVADNRLVVALDTITLNDAPGSVRADVNLAKQGFEYSGKVAFRDISFDPIIASFAPDLSGNVSGGLTSLDTEFAGAGTAPEQIRKTLVAALDLRLQKLRVERLPVLTEYADKFGLPQIKDLSFSRGNAAVKADKGNISVDSLSLGGGDQAVDLTAKVGANDALAAEVQVGIKGALEAALRQNRSLSYLAAVGVRKGDYLYLPVPIAVGGTLQHPKADLSKILQDAAKANVTNALTSALNQAVQGAQATDGKKPDTKDVLNNALDTLLGRPAPQPKPGPTPPAETVKPDGGAAVPQGGAVTPVPKPDIPVVPVPDPAKPEPAVPDGGAVEPKPDAQQVPAETPDEREHRENEERRRKRNEALGEMGGALLMDILGPKQTKPKEPAPK